MRFYAPRLNYAISFSLLHLLNWLQSSAVLTRSNITWYCIHHFSDWGRIYIRISILKKHPTPYLALAGELWGVFSDDFGENWPRYNDTALYVATSLLLPRYPLIPAKSLQLDWRIGHQFSSSGNGRLVQLYCFETYGLLLVRCVAGFWSYWICVSEIKISMDAPVYSIIYSDFNFLTSGTDSEGLVSAKPLSDKTLFLLHSPVNEFQ